ncbi:hypothetical protein FHR71_004242 [Methylobacterium sp. RAS18]|nr:hypothetical protein [Methylobacterium sp. RAS18]
MSGIRAKSLSERGGPRFRGALYLRGRGRRARRPIDRRIDALRTAGKRLVPAAHVHAFVDDARGSRPPPTLSRLLQAAGTGVFDVVLIQRADDLTLDPIGLERMYDGFERTGSALFTPTGQVHKEEIGLPGLMARVNRDPCRRWIRTATRMARSSTPTRLPTHPDEEVMTP